jgi:two-component system OmpR family sensor kinase
MGRYVNYSGLVVAGVGFFLTRFTVTLAVDADPVRFFLAGIVPLALGLGLTAFGVALAVADVEPSLARTTAVWCVVGAGTMAVLVVLTLLGSTPMSALDAETLRSRTYLANFLIGGSVGGTLTGLYASRNRRQREDMRQQAQRLEVLNRLLRHEVLNAVTVIRGYSQSGEEGADTDPAVVDEYAGAIEQTINEVKHLTWHGDAATEVVDVADCIDRVLAGVDEQFPGAETTVEYHVEDTAVRADGRLETVVQHLVENAVVHDESDQPVVDISVRETRGGIEVSVADEGPGLPDRQRKLLESGEIEEFDDPGAGFGLDIVRFLVESYGGTIETEVDDTGTTVRVILRPVGDVGPSLRAGARGVTGVRPAIPHLAVTVVAALVAGVTYGVVAELLDSPVAFIGVYYASQPDAVVGWLTHEFHSLVFAFMFAGLLSVAPVRYRDHVPGHVAIATGWGVVVWLVAAGVVSPIWLRLVGIPAPLPSLTPTLLATHVTWGATLGLLTGLGYRHVTPTLWRYLTRMTREREP